MTSYLYKDRLLPLIEKKCEELKTSHPNIDQRTFENGKRVLLHAINKAIDRRIALVAGIAALRSFSRENNDKLSHVEGLSVIKSILFLDNNDNNQFSLPLIFKLKSPRSVLHMWAKQLDLSPKLMKKYFKTPGVKSLLAEAENEYVDLYDSFLAVRNKLGASDDSSSILSSSNGIFLRVDWASSDSFLSKCLGERVTPKSNFPLSEMTWMNFFQRHCSPKKKVAWSNNDTLENSKENQCPIRHRAAHRPAAAAVKKNKQPPSTSSKATLEKFVEELSKDDEGKKKKFGGVFKCGIPYKTKGGVFNPYFKTQFKKALVRKKAEEEGKKSAGM